MDIFQVIGIYSLWLIAFGIAGNSISFYTCCKLSSTTTFVFLAFMLVSDTVSLLVWDLDCFLKAFFGFDLGENIYLCRIGNFVQFSSLQISAWLLVS